MTFPTALVAASVAFSAMFMASAAAFSVVTTVLPTAVLTFSLVVLSPQAARPSASASASEREIVLHKGETHAQRKKFVEASRGASPTSLYHAVDTRKRAAKRNVETKF